MGGVGLRFGAVLKGRSTVYCSFADPSGPQPLVRGPVAACGLCVVFMPFLFVFISYVLLDMCFHPGGIVLFLSH